MSFSNLYPVTTSVRRLSDLSGLWNFKFDPDGLGKKEKWTQGLPSPMTMPVPASFADIFTDKKSREYTGDFWYEKEIYIPGEWRDMEVGLRFEGAAHRATVYVNGTKAGSHEGGFLPFTVIISKSVAFDAPNLISVQVNNELREDCLPVGRTAELADGSKMAKGYFDFFNYSGLIRPVKLVALPKKHITDYSLTYSLIDKCAEVNYSVTANHKNGFRVSAAIYDESGNLSGEAEGKEGSIYISNVRLWEVHNAYLYKFVFKIIDGETVIDEYTDQIGIRTFEIDGHDFLLNGKPIYMKGFGKHEESESSGRGLNPSVLKRDFELMKWIGANSFRTAHYPHSEETLRLADREGIMVVDEVAAVGLMASTLNFFDASQGPQTRFFQKETTAKLLERHLQQLKELILRDKNRACVVAWCVANEPETTDDESRPYFETVFAKARALDPQHRPLTFTSLMTATPDKCKCADLCDFISLNRYYGWYVFGGNEITAAENIFRQELAGWTGRIPDKPFVFSEYGADTASGIHKLPSVMWSEEYQTEYLNMCHRVFDSLPFVRGEQVWAFADFQTGEGIMRVDGNKKGIFTRSRQPKAAAHLLKERWEGLPLRFKSEEE
ncbi:MAG: beta-glucuronidase [Oscillospiraceae bacterium]|nr:beta-glucuronidase [Oscillospiraceae bacterium]